MQQVNYSSYILHLSYTWTGGREENKEVQQLFIHFKKAYVSVRREVFIIFSLNLVSPLNW